MPRGKRLRSYKQIRAEIGKLEREADAARQAESAAVVTKLKKLIAQYGLTAADIGLDAFAASGQRAKPAAKRASAKRAARKATRPGAGVPKYRDPKSGRTWTGFGRAPDWITSAKNREALRIEATDAQPPAVPPRTKPAPVPPTAKAARKAAAKTAAPKTAASGKRSGAAKKQAAARKSALRAAVAETASRAVEPSEPPPAVLAVDSSAPPASLAATESAPT